MVLKQILSLGEKTTCSRLLEATQSVPSQKVDYNLAQVSVYKCYLGLLQRPRSPYFLVGQYPSFRLITRPVLAVIDVARTSHTTRPGASEGKRMVVKVPIVNRQQQIKGLSVQVV